MIGQTIGPYQVLSKLGEGGMGTVYRATDTTLGRQVAIKVLPETFAADPDRLARFEREAKTLATLNHPHIAAVYGFERSGSTPALVMELVDGEDLSEVIGRYRHPEAESGSSRPRDQRRGGQALGVGPQRREGKDGGIPLADALPIARQIAEALEAAHDQGIIHRDLKPANVKVRPDGTVKVLDFGLAKAMDANAPGAPADVANSPTLTARATQMGMILGTAA